ncbi:hypothetical protein [Burkholderia stagnalis]|uniref:hypothetical protein n=1 Tax=Burkholderia stagnalis TaxID=1503054 RepID=UPI000A6F506E|nr:hypothetical protein [Burkholderia stagnalis]
MTDPAVPHATMGVHTTLILGNGNAWIVAGWAILIGPDGGRKSGGRRGLSDSFELQIGDVIQVERITGRFDRLQKILIRSARFKSSYHSIARIPKQF